MSRLKEWARGLKRQTLFVYFAARDPRTPWPIRALAFTIAAYALSPIDLIPDFIPVIGYLDDLVIIPLGVYVVLRLVPPQVLADSKEKAELLAGRPVSRGMAAVVVMIWLLALAFIGIQIWHRLRI